MQPTVAESFAALLRADPAAPVAWTAAGVRTRRIAMSFALFNILVLVSRTSNSFLGPFLAKRIETRIASGGGEALYGDFQMVLGSASLAVALGIVLVPTGQRLFVRAIGHFKQHRSTVRMILHSASPEGLSPRSAPSACPLRQMSCGARPATASRV